MSSDFEEGVLVGILVGEGHFGGDGRQPHVTLRMHQRHDALFRWIERCLPGGRLYGPYDHGGRRYYQWMARGRYLREELLPLLERRLTPDVDRYVYERFRAMCSQYARQLGVAPPAAPSELPDLSGHGPTSARSPGVVQGTQHRAAAIFSQMRDQVRTEAEGASD